MAIQEEVARDCPTFYNFEDPGDLDRAVQRFGPRHPVILEFIRRRELTTDIVDFEQALPDWARGNGHEP